MPMPPEGVLLPGLDAGWSDPSQMVLGGQMPVAQAGQNGLLAALLGGGQPQQDNSAAVRALLFNQLNRPAQGPWTAIINPIVAAIQARQLAPQVQQRQAQAQQLERLKMLQALAAAGASSSMANYRNLQGQQIQSQLDAENNLTPEMRQLLYLIKNRIAPDANTLERGAQGERLQGMRGEQQTALETQRQGNRATLQAQRDAAAGGRLEYTQGSQDERARLQRENAYNIAENQVASKEREGDANRYATMSANRARIEANAPRNAALTRKYEADEARAKMAALKDEIATDPTSLQNRLNEAQEIYRGLKPGQQRTDFLRNNVAPLYEASTGQKLNIEQPGAWAQLRDFMFGDYFGSSGEPITVNPEKPRRMAPARTLAPGQRPPADAQPVDFESLSDDDLLSISDEQAAVMPASVRRRRSLLKGKQKFGLGTR